MRLQTALHAIYPPECLGCSAPVAEEFGLCGACWGETPFIFGTCCDLCGAPLPGLDVGEDTLICDDCHTHKRPWHRGRATMVYADLGRRLVLSLKHGDRADVARAAGPWLARSIAPLIDGEDPLDIRLVPIPLHPLRLLKRGFNQAALLARALARETNCGLAVDALIRTRGTPPLGGLSVDERFDALEGAILPHRKRGVDLSGTTVVLIDDVMTSGATFAAAAKAARRAGAKKVSVLALARAARTV